jgi:hypothetical protein
MNVVTGNDAGNALSGTAGGDLIYGYDPNAADVSATISTTRVATGLDQPLYVTAAPGGRERIPRHLRGREGGRHRSPTGFGDNGASNLGNPPTLRRSRLRPGMHLISRRLSGNCIFTFEH